MANDPLKPCPWCGPGEHCPPQLEGEPHGDGTAYFVRCPCCACEGPWGKSKEAAVGGWNRRYEPEDAGPKKVPQFKFLWTCYKCHRMDTVIAPNRLAAGLTAKHNHRALRDPFCDHAPMVSEVAVPVEDDTDAHD